MPIYSREQLLAFMPEDGTYLVTAVGLSNVAFKRITQDRGYQIGYDELARTGVESPSGFVSDGDMVGRWTDEGRVYLDRTVLFVGPEDLALGIAETYNQQCIWDWATSTAIANPNYY